MDPWASLRRNWEQVACRPAVQPRPPGLDRVAPRLSRLRAPPPMSSPPSDAGATRTAPSVCSPICSSPPNTTTSPPTACSSRSSPDFEPPPADDGLPPSTTASGPPVPNSTSTPSASRGTPSPATPANDTPIPPGPSCARSNATCAPFTTPTGGQRTAPCRSLTPAPRCSKATRCQSQSRAPPGPSSRPSSRNLLDPASAALAYRVAVLGLRPMVTGRRLGLDRRGTRRSLLAAYRSLNDAKRAPLTLPSPAAGRRFHRRPETSSQEILLMTPIAAHRQTSCRPHRHRSHHPLRPDGPRRGVLGPRRHQPPGPAMGRL